MPTRPDGRPVRGLSQAELAELARRALGAHAGEAVATAMPVESFHDDAWVRLPREHSLETLRRLKSDPDASFEMLLDVTCAHFPRRPAPLGAFDVIYHLLSLTRGHRLRVKVACPDPDQGVDSVVSLWPGANFMEREAYDMFGVRFLGHPDLRRILMSEEFAGFPMRKDFPYRGH